MSFPTEPLSDPVELIIPHDCRGLRLDQALVRIMPGLGRRGACDLWTRFVVLVDGRRRAAGFRVQGGQIVTLKTAQGAGHEAQPPSFQASFQAMPTETRVRVVAQDNHFAALVKPPGMHSEALARGRGPSLEAALPGLFPKRRAMLLNRLDKPVSGLVLAALDESAARDYAQWQDQGQVLKLYLAVVGGCMREVVEIRASLDTAKRRAVRVLSEVEPDPLRWTRVVFLAYREESDESLVRVEISKGRRHQIRVHLASVGHPVKLDPLYGAGPDLGWIYLHHYGIMLPGFAAVELPGWEDWEAEIGAVASSTRLIHQGLGKIIPVEGP